MAKAKIPKFEELFAPQYKWTEHTKITDYSIRAVVLSIRDGDSLTVRAFLPVGDEKDKFPIRFLGVNSPESSPGVEYSKHTKEEWAKLEKIGLKAKARLAQLLKNPLVKIYTEKIEMDGRARYLASKVINGDGVDVVAQMKAEMFYVEYAGEGKANDCDFSELIKFHYPNG